MVVQESLATVITEYESNVVPGLLQTENYAETLMRWGGLLTPDNVELRVRARMARQGLFQRSTPPRCLFFLREHALRTVVGDSRLMHEQMLYLLLTGAHPRCAVRVVLDSTGPNTWNSFRVMEYDKYPSIVYAEGICGGTFLEVPSDVITHRTILGKLENAALDEEESRAWLTDLAAAYDHEEAAHSSPPRPDQAQQLLQQ
ncbi:DUF5753 domain-containing protein [Amycolatopsis minnesotensis]|uniref:DUF5753 domain-containing protein n=1 Tax=Amycolatopsis minnesotensis TaxID=337894 RepID=UPI0031DBD2A7